MPLPKRLLAFASGVKNIAQAIADADFPSETYFATLEEDGAVTILESNLLLGEIDVIFFGLTNPGNISDYFTMMNGIGLSSSNPLDPTTQQHQPLVCAGGWGTFNPEAFASLFDIVFLGNAIEAAVLLCDVLTKFGKNQRNDLQFWKHIVQTPHIYVPHLYNCVIDQAGRISSITPKYGWVPERVSFGIDKDFASQLVFDGETAVITVTRGCAYHCAFCQIGSEHYRETPITILKEQIKEAAVLGAKQIILNSATLSRYSQVDELLDELYQTCAEYPHMTAVIGSLRADELSESTLARMGRIDNFSNTLRYYRQENQQKFLTLAPEVGTDEIRLMIGKNMTNEVIFETIRRAQNFGFSNFVLYFIIGFDFHDDAEDIIQFVQEVLKLTHDNQGRLMVRLTPFIPSVRTPMQRFGMLGVTKTWALIDKIFNAFDADETKRLEFSCAMTQGRYAYEALCMRGDRRISNVLADLHAQGINHHTHDVTLIENALAEHNLTLDWYMRRIPEHEIVPWMIIDEVQDRVQSNLLTRLIPTID